MSTSEHTVKQNAHGDFDVISPSGAVAITYPTTAKGGAEHAEMLAGADADSRNGMWDSPDGEQ